MSRSAVNLLTSRTLACKIFLRRSGISSARSASITLACLGWEGALMTALAPSNTVRFKCFYTNLSHQHVLQIRSTNTPGVVGGIIDDIFTALTGSIASTTIDSVESAPVGSDIFNPVVSGIEGNTYGISGHPASDAATFWSWVGRTAGGRRIRLFVFGMGGMGTDYRYNPGEDSHVDNVVAALNTAAGNIIAIDGLQPVWKSYANAGVNDLWVKNLRP